MSRAVGAKELKEYMEVRGYADAARWVYGQALEPGSWTDGNLLNLREVRTIHHKAMEPVWSVSPHPHAHPNEAPGNWRRHEIQPFPGGMQPPAFTDIPALVQDWVAAVNELSPSIAPEKMPESVARLHNAFERIHPFLDGNGRSGRLLLNLVLVRLKYPPAIIYKRQRSRYLNAMKRADNDDHGPLGELIARSVTDNLYRFVMPAIAGPARLVPLASLAAKGTSAESLRIAVIRGRLRAVKSNTGTWMSSRKWLSDYVQTKYRRTKKPPPAGAD